MATILARTTLANGATTTVATDGAQNIFVNVHKGKATINVIADSAQTDGYAFTIKQSAVVVALAYSLIIEGRGKDGCEVEVYTI